MPEKKLELPEYDYQSLYPNTKTLSSSQVLCYLEDPAKFYTENVLGVRREPTVPMQIGSVFSALHKDRNYDFKAALKMVGAQPRIADIMERHIKMFPVVPAEVPLIAEYRKWKFRATLDGYVESEYTIIENKTGGRDRMYGGWTQERVNFDKQVTFQAWVHWKKYGVIPKRVLLNWLCLVGSGGSLHPFKTTRSTKGLKQFEQLIDLVIDNIEAENWTKPIYQ